MTNLAINFRSASDDTRGTECNKSVPLEDLACAVKVVFALYGSGFLAVAQAGIGSEGWHV